MSYIFGMSLALEPGTSAIFHFGFSWIYMYSRLVIFTLLLIGSTFYLEQYRVNNLSNEFNPTLNLSTNLQVHTTKCCQLHIKCMKGCYITLY